jgi:hypothetical protein
MTRALLMNLVALATGRPRGTTAGLADGTRERRQPSMNAARSGEETPRST